MRKSNSQWMALCALVLVAAAPAFAQKEIYNTVKSKLAAGEQVFGGTVLTGDPEIYCAMANSGWDFLWIEMQHSPLTYQEVAHMIAHCPDATAIPFIRVPDATPGDIQKAVDIGALGVIVPMVQDVQEVLDAVRFAKYPPMGERSQGNGQYGQIWGRSYRQTANDNVMIVGMVENPKGVDIADQIAAVDGVDVVFVASSDLGSFSGKRQGDPEYEALVSRTRDAVLAAGKIVGGPQAWRDREGYHFFQGAPDTAIIRQGTRAALGLDGPQQPRSGVAPIEGQEK